MAGNEQAIKKVEKRIDALEKVIKTLPNLIVKKDEIRWSKHDAKIDQAFGRTDQNINDLDKKINQAFGKVAGDNGNLVRAIKKVQDDVIKNKTYNKEIVERALTSIIDEFEARIKRLETAG
ncbi:MAG: hypothetical protein IID48_08925 [Proteobacteria bacterium]|nr:hypothetical protein [Pseudomonadota bacterium]